MTDAQFKELMERLDKIERQMQAGTWWPNPPVPTGPNPYLPPPMYPADPRYWPTDIPRITD